MTDAKEIPEYLKSGYDKSYLPQYWWLLCPCFREPLWTVSSLKQFKTCRSVWQYQFSLVVSCFTNKISRMDISICVVNRRLQGRSQEFSKGGHTGSYRGYSPDCHLNIVGCLLTKRHTKGGGGGGGFTGTPGPLWLRPWEKKPKAPRYWRFACWDTRHVTMATLPRVTVSWY